MSHILIIYMTIKHILFMTATYLSIYTKRKRICNLSNHNPTLLKTTSGSTSHTICKSFNCSFVHLLSSLLILSLPWLYFPLVFWSRHSKLLLTDVTASGASFPSFADVLPSAWKAPARLSNKVSTEIHLNHHFLQRAFSDALRICHIPLTKLSWRHALHLIFLCWVSSMANHTRYWVFTY